jgi:hypothetical protein
MTDDNSFFRWLGRINSILFFLVVAGAGLLIGANAGLDIFIPQHNDAHAVVETASGDTYDFGGSLNVKEDYSSAMTRLEGTQEGFMVLQRASRGGSLGSRGGYGTANVNVLLFDLRTMQSHWMFEGTRQDIERAYAVHAVVPVPNDGADPVTALLMPVATRDTNGDGKIDRNDADSLYVHRPGSAGAVKLLDAVSVNTIEQIDSDRVLVTYYDGKIDHAAMLSAKDFSIIASAAISPKPN